MNRRIYIVGKNEREVEERVGKTKEQKKHGVEGNVVK